jgi:hypothetical protein
MIDFYIAHELGVALIVAYSKVTPDPVSRPC